MQGAGSALMGIGSARGADRAIKAAELAVASPLLEASIDGAHGVLLSIQGGSNLGIFEINDAARLVQEAVHPEANIIFGAVIDDTLGDEVRVTVIAAGFDSEPLPKSQDTRRSTFVNTGAAASAAVAAPPAAAAPAAAAASTQPVHSWSPEPTPPVTAQPDRAFDDDGDDDLDVPDFLK
jgi:cell division protein FtsZ